MNVPVVNVNVECAGAGCECECAAGECECDSRTHIHTHGSTFTFTKRTFTFTFIRTSMIFLKVVRFAGSCGPDGEFTVARFFLVQWSSVPPNAVNNRGHINRSPDRGRARATRQRPEEGPQRKEKTVETIGRRGLTAYRNSGHRQVLFIGDALYK